DTLAYLQGLIRGIASVLIVPQEVPGWKGFPCQSRGGRDWFGAHLPQPPSDKSLARHPGSRPSRTPARAPPVSGVEHGCAPWILGHPLSPGEPQSSTLEE